MEADAFTIWSQANQEMQREYIQDGSLAPNVKKEVVNLIVHEGHHRCTRFTGQPENEGG
jgi:hypothetical protein